MPKAAHTVYPASACQLMHPPNPPKTAIGKPHPKNLVETNHTHASPNQPTNQRKFNFL
ncbi:hypothetical protein BS50DRAFT_570390 [Corynespora cassiicola Philippines]|uniref:Uncharacterized protein n=1 Tax=Corynespora cassiicola Philippines TaxID=1448308 RepID=A0A2T2P031_CORCC|nr:hypothetical protein BS50DRAFT_570390 [Corynespora cassiicola Philippines]